MQTNIVGGFMAGLLEANKQITYNPQFMDHKLRVEKGEICFINAVIHPRLRVVLRPNELAMSRSEPPAGNQSKANVLLFRGTEYGTIVMYGIESQYGVEKKTGRYIGPTPSLRVPQSFMWAAVRYFKRAGKPFSILKATPALLEWIFSKDFQQNLQEQAAIDKASGITLGDMLPAKPPRPVKAPA